MLEMVQQIKAVLASRPIIKSLNGIPANIDDPNWYQGFVLSDGTQVAIWIENSNDGRDCTNDWVGDAALIVERA